MKSLIVMCLLFVSMAHAGDRTSTYNIICKPMTFEADRNNCIAKLKLYSYYDLDGVRLCAAATFESERISCIDFIGDKTYEGYEMDNCRNKTFESERRECLRESGTIYNPNRPVCVSREENIEHLSKAIKDLRAGNLNSADQRMNYLLNRYIDCR